jgi:hypothetical protein
VVDIIHIHCLAGRQLTAEEEEKVGVWDTYPNAARWISYFMADPQRIADYMAANCSTTTVGGQNLSGWLEWEDFNFYLGESPACLLVDKTCFPIGRKM